MQNGLYLNSPLISFLIPLEASAHHQAAKTSYRTMLTAKKGPSWDLFAIWQHKVDVDSTCAAFPHSSAQCHPLNATPITPCYTFFHLFGCLAPQEGRMSLNCLVLATLPHYPRHATHLTPHTTEKSIKTKFTWSVVLRRQDLGAFGACKIWSTSHSGCAVFMLQKAQ